MRIIVAVIVYNRLNNIKRWINCWEQCNRENADLVVIHNFYGDEKEKAKFKSVCDNAGIKYIPRSGSGFDIGGFQDVCNERLAGFDNDWTHLLWITDDVIPMSKDFIKPFTDKLLDPDVGISCMQIASSTQKEIHVRTTGFCLRKETSLKLKFPADPIVTKHHCYLFEHRGGKNTLTEQVRAMGLSCEQVAPNATSPLWDQGYHKRLDRMNEHEKIFGSENTGNKVAVICPIFDAFPEIISSLMCQSHKDWQLLLIDDNPDKTVCMAIVEAINDNRITYIKRERLANYGHPHRQWALKELSENRLCPDADFVLITNGDNGYAPVFLEYMLEGFKNNPLARAVYCSEMVHSYIKWNVIKCRPALGFLDCGGVIVKKDIACEIGWNDITSHSSDFMYFEDIIRQYSLSSFVPVKGTLFMHN